VFVTVCWPTLANSILDRTRSFELSDQHPAEVQPGTRDVPLEVLSGDPEPVEPDEQVCPEADCEEAAGAGMD